MTDYQTQILIFGGVWLLLHAIGSGLIYYAQVMGANQNVDH